MLDRDLTDLEKIWITTLGGTGKITAVSMVTQMTRSIIDAEKEKREVDEISRRTALEYLRTVIETFVGSKKEPYDHLTGRADQVLTTFWPEGRGH